MLDKEPMEDADVVGDVPIGPARDVDAPLGRDAEALDTAPVTEADVAGEVIVPPPWDVSLQDVGNGAEVPPIADVKLPDDTAVGPASEVEAPPDDDRLAGEVALAPTTDVELLTG